MEIPESSVSIILFITSILLLILLDAFYSNLGVKIHLVDRSKIILLIFVSFLVGLAIVIIGFAIYYSSAQYELYKQIMWLRFFGIALGILFAILLICFAHNALIYIAINVSPLLVRTHN